MKLRPILALLLFFTISATTADGATVDIRVMSFNVRRAASVDEYFGGNGWLSSPVRRGDLVNQTVLAYQPDILAVQEPYTAQVNYMKAALADYAFYGVGRDDGVAANEYAGIFYRADRFTLLDQGNFWLSTTPDIPGTAFGPDPTARIATWAILFDHASKQPIFFMNTHWDHSSSAARENSATLIRSRLPELAGDLPIILAGDFNASETSTAMRRMVGQFDPNGLQLLNSYRQAHPTVSSQELTFHNFTGNTVGSRIDLILHTDHLTAVEASIVRTSYNGRWPSDHYPVTATLRIQVVPEPTTATLLTVAVVLVALGRLRVRAGQPG